MDYTRKAIQELAMHDPVVRAAMAARANHGGPYEEMLIVIVMHLASVARDYKELALNLAKMKCPDPSKHFHNEASQNDNSEQKSDTTEKY